MKENERTEELDGLKFPAPFSVIKNSKWRKLNAKASSQEILSDTPSKHEKNRHHFFKMVSLILSTFIAWQLQAFILLIFKVSSPYFISMILIFIEIIIFYGLAYYEYKKTQ